MFRWWSDANPFLIPLLAFIAVLSCRRFSTSLPLWMQPFIRRTRDYNRALYGVGSAVVAAFLFFEMYYQVYSCAVSSRYEHETLFLARKVIDILDAHGITYWFDFATLLSVLRSQTINPWDHDADISIVRPKEGHAYIQRLLEDAGLYTTYDPRDLIQVVRNLGDSTVRKPHFDVWLWTDVTDAQGRALTTPDPDSPAPRRQYSLVLPVQKLPWRGSPDKEVSVPADPHKIAHMEFDRFGGDYMVAQVFRGDCFHNFFNGRWFY